MCDSAVSFVTSQDAWKDPSSNADYEIQRQRIETLLPYDIFTGLRVTPLHSMYVAIVFLNSEHLGNLVCSLPTDYNLFLSLIFFVMRYEAIISFNLKRDRLLAVILVERARDIMILTRRLTSNHCVAYCVPRREVEGGKE